MAFLSILFWWLLCFCTARKAFQKKMPRATWDTSCFADHFALVYKVLREESVKIEVPWRPCNQRKWKLLCDFLSFSPPRKSGLFCLRLQWVINLPWITDESRIFLTFFRLLVTGPFEENKIFTNEKWVNSFWTPTYSFYKGKTLFNCTSLQTFYSRS